MIQEHVYTIIHFKQWSNYNREYSMTMTFRLNFHHYVAWWELELEINGYLWNWSTSKDQDSRSTTISHTLDTLYVQMGFISEITHPIENNNEENHKVQKKSFRMCDRVGTHILCINRVGLYLNGIWVFENQPKTDLNLIKCVTKYMCI